MQESGIATSLNKKTLLKAWKIMCQAWWMAKTYDEHRQETKYVHSTSRGHEAIQIATGLLLKPQDYLAPYYRDESLLMAIGFKPYELMLQLLAKKDDYFSGGRCYYSHPSSRLDDRPKIPHQSSATGMQVIPATGMAQGIAYLESQGLLNKKLESVAVCSMGDGSVTEGEVSEAFQFAVLKELPILYLVQDNDWGISVSADEARKMNAYEYASGFKGLKRMQVDGADFLEAYQQLEIAFDYIRKKRKPVLLHAKVPLLGHHTSGVRMEWYRTPENLEEHFSRDPNQKLRDALYKQGISEQEIRETEEQAKLTVEADFQKAVNAAEPDPASVNLHEFAPTPVIEEVGQRSPKGNEKVVMVDAALHAVEEILRQYPEALFYGQDVGRRLGGVFREAATLAQKFGDDRVFNTAIQEAYLVGSTAGMSAVGAKAIVEIQFADYIWPGVNQLVEELSKSCYLTMGKYPVQSLIRVPIGAYGGGGPYHSGCIESSILPVKGIKVVYPSNAADMKGLMKAAFLDPNPVVIFEHKGLYWSKVPGTDLAKSIEPDENYMIPLGKARIAQEADADRIANGESVTVITYGMGVYWAINASGNFPGQIEVIDLRTLYPLDEETIYQSVKLHNKCMVLTEEPLENSFAESLAGRISLECFEYLDAPVHMMGAQNLPAVPLNIGLEKEMLPNVEKVSQMLAGLLTR